MSDSSPSGGDPPRPPPPAGSPALGPARIVLAAIAVLLPIPVATAVALGVRVDALAVLGVIAGVGAATAVLRRLGHGWGELGMRRPRSAAKTVAAAIGVAVLLQVLTAVLAPLVVALTRSPPDISRFDVLRGNPRALAVILVIVWTSAAFGEEMLFRGFLVPLFEGFAPARRARTVLAVVLSSIVFGAGHAYQGITGVVLTGFIGLALAGAYLRAGRNLWVPILAHGFYDTFGVVVVFLNADRPAH